jgi:tetratricopeptide (TPR) repeat protein
MWQAGRLCESLQRFRESAQGYGQLLQESPHWDRLDEVLLGHARASLALGKGDAAAISCQTVLADFPHSPQTAEAAYWLACRAADEQNRGLAEANLKRMFAALEATSPDDRRRQLLLLGVRLKCHLAADAGAWEEVVEVVNSDQLTAVRDEAELVFWRAEAALRLHDSATARRLFESLTRQAVGTGHRWTPLIPLRRAQMAAHNRQWSKVLELLEVFDTQYSDFNLMYEVDYLRGRALAGLGDMDAARAAYAEVVQNPQAHQSETATQAAWMIGQTHFHQHNYQQAGMV